MTTEPLPPRLLAFRIRHNNEALTLARIDIRADDGEHSFLVTRDILRMIQDRCATAINYMPSPSDLS
jgi:hypothetical protein